MQCFDWSNTAVLEIAYRLFRFDTFKFARRGEDLAVSAIDDGRKTQHRSVGVIEHWVNHRLLDDGHKTAQLQVMLLVMLQKDTFSGS